MCPLVQYVLTLFLHFQILYELVMPNSNIQIILMSFANKTLDVATQHPKLQLILKFDDSWFTS